jgi:hypothetical protein
MIGFDLLVIISQIVRARKESINIEVSAMIQTQKVALAGLLSHQESFR